jgi:hypothetical protein
MQQAADSVLKCNFNKALNARNKTMCWGHTAHELHMRDKGSGEPPVNESHKISMQCSFLGWHMHRYCQTISALPGLDTATSMLFTSRETQHSGVSCMQACTLSSDAAFQPCCAWRLPMCAHLSVLMPYFRAQHSRQPTFYRSCRKRQECLTLQPPNAADGE